MLKILALKDAMSNECKKCFASCRCCYLSANVFCTKKPTEDIQTSVLSEIGRCYHLQQPQWVFTQKRRRKSWVMMFGRK